MWRPSVTLSDFIRLFLGKLPGGRLTVFGAHSFASNLCSSRISGGPRKKVPDATVDLGDAFIRSGYATDRPSYLNRLQLKVGVSVAQSVEHRTLDRNVAESESHQGRSVVSLSKTLHRHCLVLVQLM